MKIIHFKRIGNMIRNNKGTDHSLLVIMGDNNNHDYQAVRFVNNSDKYLVTLTNNISKIVL